MVSLTRGPGSSSSGSQITVRPQATTTGASNNKMDEVIKTTARFQEADEPAKQKPVFQIERPLPNTIRASIDSGRDNPFRPDGVIYKSADPIVDYYLYGPNSSRPQSPTDSQLLLNGTNQGDGKKKKRKRKETTDPNETKKPCWRRWLCCCCCCCHWCSRENSNEAATGPKATKGTTREKASQVGARESQGKNNNQDVYFSQTTNPYDSVTSSTTTTGPLSLESSKTKESKQTKIVVLKDGTSDTPATNSSKVEVSLRGTDRPVIVVDRTNCATTSTSGSGVAKTKTSSTQTKVAKSNSKCIVS